jgi:hypothetical protein
MPQGIWVRTSSGNWRLVDTDEKLSIRRDSGVYEPAQAGWVYVNGNWRQFYAQVTNVLPASFSASPTFDYCPTNMGVRLTWTNPISDTKTLQWSPTGTGSWTTLSSSLGTSVTSYDHQPVDDNTTYFYRIRYNNQDPNEWAETNASTGECII